jgi:ferrochelatase
MNQNKLGVLLCNIGTPDQPTPAAVRRYLKEFLSDRRVVEIPRLLWWPILHGVILRTRPKRSAELYKKIWTEQGSPLLYHSQQLTKELEKKLQIPVVLGMHYGKPSIKNALEELREKNVTKILILPLYPQYSATTTAAAFDHVAKVLKTWRNIPEIQLLHDYADHAGYINTITQSIQMAEQQYGKPDHLLFSFHGIPKRFIALGDPYEQRCRTTVQQVVRHCDLRPEEYSIAFQSRLGRAAWLQPYTDKILKELPQKGIKHVHVICPGFAVDCLETLEEIAILGKKHFLENGGKIFHYIPALNESNLQVDMLAELIGSVDNRVPTSRNS